VKSKPVIGGFAGGITAQVVYGVTGYTVNSVEGAAFRARQLLADRSCARVSAPRPAGTCGSTSSSRATWATCWPSWRRSAAEHAAGARAADGPARAVESAERGFAALGTTRCARSARVSYKGAARPRAATGVRGHRKRAGREAPEHWTGPRRLWRGPARMVHFRAGASVGCAAGVRVGPLPYSGFVSVSRQGANCGHRSSTRRPLRPRPASIRGPSPACSRRGARDLTVLVDRTKVGVPLTA